MLKSNLLWARNIIGNSVDSLSYLMTAIAFAAVISYVFSLGFWPMYVVVLVALFVLLCGLVVLYGIAQLLYQARSI